VLAVSQRLPVTSSRHPLPSQASADVESVHLFPVLLPHDAMFNGCLRSETGLAGSLCSTCYRRYSKPTYTTRLLDVTFCL